MSSNKHNNEQIFLVPYKLLIAALSHPIHINDVCNLHNRFCSFYIYIFDLHFVSTNLLPDIEIGLNRLGSLQYCKLCIPVESVCPPCVTMGFLWLSHINHKYSRVGKKRASNLPFETECLSVHHLTVYWCMSHLRPIVAQISHFTLRADLWLYPLVCQLQPLKCFHDLIPTTKDLTIGSRVQNDKSNTRDWSKTPL